jgi:hypothetical protein
MGDIFVETKDSLRMRLSANGKWYSGSYEEFSAALLPHATGVVDFEEDSSNMWRERWAKDGTIHQFPAVVTYVGDDPDL